MKEYDIVRLFYLEYTNNVSRDGESDDGDEGNVTIANDKETAREFLNFSLHYGAYIPTKPFSPSKALSIPDTAVVNISSFIVESSYEEHWIDEELLKIIS